MRKWDNESNKGWIIERAHCPKCNGPIVYNGNYFCAKLGDFPGGCDYAMPQGEWDITHRTPEDERILELGLLSLGSL